MMSLPQLFLTIALSLAFLVSGCSQSGKDDSDTPKNDPDNGPVQVERVSLSGLAVKGVLASATVTARSVDGRKTFGTVQTREDGSYSLTELKAGDQPVLVELTTDADTLHTCDSPEGCRDSNNELIAFGQRYHFNDPEFILTAILPGKKGTRSEKLVITPITHLAARRAIKEQKTTPEGIHSINTATANLLGLAGIDINTTSPADITQSSVKDAGAQSQKYAAIVASIAALATEKSRDIAKVVNDLSEQYATKGGLVSNSTDKQIVSLKDIFQEAKKAVQQSEATTGVKQEAITQELQAIENQAAEQTPDQIVVVKPVIKVATFTIRTNAANNNGSISPANASVAKDAVKSFTIKPDSGFAVTSVKGCDGTLSASGTVYTTGKISEDCTVSAEFGVSHLVKAEINNGTVSPTSEKVLEDSDGEQGKATFTFTPETGHKITNISSRGCSGKRVDNRYTVSKVKAACIVSATTELKSYDIKASIDSGRFELRSPTVKHGQSISIAFFPAQGRRVASVTGCKGTLKGDTFTISEVTESCTAVAKTELASTTATIKVNSATGGSLIYKQQPVDKPVSVVLNTSVELQIQPEPNYSFGKMSVDTCGGSLNKGQNIPPGAGAGQTPSPAGSTVYTISKLTKDCELTPEFVELLIVTVNLGNTTIPNGSVIPMTGLVPKGTTKTFTLKPSPGYEVDTASGCGGTLSADKTTLTTGPIQDNCAITATFKASAGTPVISYGLNRKIIFNWSEAQGAPDTTYKIREKAVIEAGDEANRKSNALASGINRGIKTHTAQKVSLAYSANSIYTLDTCIGERCTESVSVFNTPDINKAITYLKASNTGIDDSYGHAVAINASATIMAVSAPREDSNAKGVNSGDQENNASENSGAVYIYSLNASNEWEQKAYIKAPANQANMQFGYSLAISNDGNTLMVGAPFQKVDGNDQTGAVHVYELNAQTKNWEYKAELKASNPDENDHFGYSLSLNQAANTLAVGAPHEDSNSTTIDDSAGQSDNSKADSGAVYIFKKTSEWADAVSTYIKPGNTDAGDLFGYTLSLVDDVERTGNQRLAVGAPHEKSLSNEPGNNADTTPVNAGGAGAVYMFEKNQGQWNQTSYIKAFDDKGAPKGYTGNLFGATLALSHDAKKLIVGAPGEDNSQAGINSFGSVRNTGATDSGAAYLFSLESNVWKAKLYFKPNDQTDIDAAYGSSVAFTPGDKYLAIGSTGERGRGKGLLASGSNTSSKGSGAVYLYQESNSQSGQWPLRRYLKSPNSDEGDNFGGAIATAEEDNKPILLISAPAESSQRKSIPTREDDLLSGQKDNSKSKSGAAYLY